METSSSVDEKLSDKEMNGGDIFPIMSKHAESSDIDEYEPGAEDEDEDEDEKTKQAEVVGYHNRWSSDGGPVELDSDPSSDLDNDYYSDEASVNGNYGEKTDEYESNPIAQQTRQDKARLLALRRHLDELSEQVLEKDYIVIQSREELKKCRDVIESLEHQIEDVRKQIEIDETNQYMASLGRLNSQYSKLCAELANEKDVLKVKTKQLSDAEYALAQATAEQGKFLVAGEEVERNDRMVERHKQEASASRIRRENATAAVVDRRRRTREKEHVSALRERERKHRQALTAAKRNREHATKFLKETMSRVRQKEAEEEERSREYLDNRMQAVLTLKRNIETNKENLKALQARDAKLAREKEEQEEQERAELLAQGLNPDELMTRRKRIQQFEKDKEAFEKRQRERQIDIADHILKEEKQMKKRYQQQPQLWPDKQRERSKRATRRRPKPKFFKSTSGSSSMEYSADVEDTGDKWIAGRLVAVSSDDDDFSPYGETSRDEAKAGDSDIDITEDLAEPEFKGLWEVDNDQGVSNKTSKTRFTAHVPTTMEQEIMDRSLMRQRAGIVQKQVAAGREFKGCAFYSKPEVIIFKDFDVGKSYRKKVVLTNISYTQNFCKYIGMSHVLKDFIEIQFDPPGVMSAGLTCDFIVTFKPMLNEDLEGQIDFLAQTGPFALPIKCMTKKCQVKVDVVEVDFASQVVGETRKRIVTMTNNGALGTDFDFKKISALDRSDATSDISSIGGMTITEENGEAEPEAEETKTEGIVDTATASEGNADEQPDKAGIPVSESKSGCDEKATVVQFEDGEPENLDEPPVDEGDGFDTGITTDSPVPTDVMIMDGLKVGKVASGHIGPFSTVQLEILFAPVKAGNVLSDFEISFNDPLSPPIMVRGRGCGIDVPVWVEREVVDLKICMYDRLYQDAIVVNNRATSALRLKFEVCKELKNHLELLPKMAYIQAESQFSAQLKFLPRQSLPTECPSYFDQETGLLEAPMLIRVADQTRAVPFTVRAIVTSSDIEFNVQELDFGYCTLYESVRHTVTLVNKSVLPQPFGFCGTPDTVDVQPNDGFGTLLPFERLDIDIIFNAKKAKEYSFVLTCKSGIGREFKLPCRAVGVLPPLELSHTLIQMKATAIDDTCSAHLEVINPHTSANEFTHPVPRIGTGPVCEVGPTSFEFVVPQGAPLNVSPSVGVVYPGKRCIVHVTFNPRLDVQQVKHEAVKIIEREAEAERKRKEAASPTEKAQDVPSNQKKKPKGKSGKSSPKRNATPSSPSHSRKPSAKTTAKPQCSVEDITEGSNDYESAHLSLMRTLPNEFSRYVIPCFVASGKCTEPGTLPCSAHNTLYLEVHCPTVTPSVVVISDSGRNVVDFGNVSLGQSDLKTITIQNIYNETLCIKSSLLDPHGPFQLLNALRSLEPQATHTVVLSFEPNSAKEFNEVLELHCSRNTLSIRLKGRGVTPAISLSIPDGELDLGDALVNDSVISTFKINNTSELAITYNLRLDSQSSLRHSRAQALPGYLEQYTDLHDKKWPIVGPSNCNGVAVIDCVPERGIIAPGESKEITVTFAPDHPSVHYVDVMSVVINDGDKADKIKLTGRGWPSLVFIQGFDELMPSIESLVPQTEHDDEEDTKVVKTVLLSFKSCSSPEGFGIAERHLEIGCIKSSIQTKKSSDYFFENPKEANEKGFTFDPMKAGVDIGSKKTITCRWQPPPGHDPNTPINTNTVLTVKADVTTQYKISLQGFVTSIQQTNDRQPTGPPSPNN